MYACGPTLYNNPHIGNFRPIIVFDILFRILQLKFGEGNVTYVRNITDIDDAILDLKVFPNPSMELLNIQINHTTIDQVFISISDLTGNEVFSAAGANVFDAMTDLASSLRNEDRASFDLAFEALDASMTVVNDARSTFGVRMNQVGEQQSLNESFNLQLTKTLSGLEDLDFAKAISDMNLQLVALEAAQQAYTQSQSTSLFDYLR